MDVNSKEWSQETFDNLKSTCRHNSGWKCEYSGFACKDYLCPYVKNGLTLEGVKKNFETQY